LDQKRSVAEEHAKKLSTTSDTMGKLVRLFVMSRQGFNMDRGIGKRDGSVQSKKDVDLAEICDQHDSSLGVKVVLGREGGDGNVLEGLVTEIAD
jgi:hypothetical protein